MTEESPLDVLARWEGAGAPWRVYELTDDRAVIELCACTGEPMERVESTDSDVIAALRRREEQPASGHRA